MIRRKEYIFADKEKKKRKQKNSSTLRSRSNVGKFEGFEELSRNR